MTRQVLLVEDDSDFRSEMRALLEAMGHRVAEARNAEHALRVFDPKVYDLVITDVRMSAMPGTTLCKLLVERAPSFPVIVMTGFGSIELAVETLRMGAFDFLAKPFGTEQLQAAVERALHHGSLVRELRRLEERGSGERDHEIAGESPPIRELRDLIQRVARSDASVLIEGESGTGKELVARSIHRQGDRKNGPFVAINCAAIPETLLESELFGYAKGAFTDAKSGRRGLLCEASGGTLFLDEVGEMSSSMQAKLLRALESRKVRPVGSQDEVDFDVRLICATHRDLEASVHAGEFRADLLYRIHVIHLAVPPLRVRGQDILLLAQRFLDRKRPPGSEPYRLSPDMAAKLLRYPWPGNVRELQNAMERATALSNAATLGIADLPLKIREFQSTNVSFVADGALDLVSLEEMERRYILQVLEAVGQNKVAATQILGIDRSTLYRKMERYGLRSSGTDGPNP